MPISYDTTTFPKLMWEFYNILDEELKKYFDKTYKITYQIKSEMPKIFPNPVEAQTNTKEIRYVEIVVELIDKKAFIKILNRHKFGIVMEYHGIFNTNYLDFTSEFYSTEIRVRQENKDAVIRIKRIIEESFKIFRRHNENKYDKINYIRYKHLEQ